MMKHIMVCDLSFDPFTLPSPFPTITVTSTYQEIRFNVQVTDPESTPAQTDILLVTASYLTNLQSTPQEVSLIVLDDGSTNKFDFQQKAGFYGEDCTADPQSCPDCNTKTYELTSNDMTAGDGTYTRGFAFKQIAGGSVPAGNRAEALFEDCLVSQKHQAPAESSNQNGQPISFKIEAIDRSGNIGTWSKQEEVTVQPSALTCEGDVCGCCFLMSSFPLGPASPNHPNPVTGCVGLPGLIGQPGSGYECGFCEWLRFQACL